MPLQRLKTGVPAKNATEALANTILTKTIHTKEKVRKKTMGLWDTARQLKGLSDLLANPATETDGISGQSRLSIEPTVAPADNLLKPKTEVAATKAPGRDYKTQKTNTVKTPGTKAVKASEKTNNKNGNDPKATNPKMITRKDKAGALPDIPAREILKELKDIEKLIRERRPGSAPRPESQEG